MEDVEAVLLSIPTTPPNYATVDRKEVMRALLSAITLRFNNNHLEVRSANPAVFLQEVEATVAIHKKQSVEWQAK